MPARNRQCLTWCLLSASMVSLSAGCSLFPGLSDRPKSPAPWSDRSRDYPVRVSPSDPNKPTLSLPVSRPMDDAKSSKANVAPAAFPPEAPRPPAITPPSVTNPPSPTILPNPPKLDPPPAAPPEPPLPIVIPAPPPPPIVAALQHFLENRPDRALDDLKGYPPEVQKMLIHLLPLVATLADDKVNPNDPATAEHMAEQLKSCLAELHMPLAIDKMCYCKDAKSFGCYEPLQLNYQFHAGTGDHAGERVRVYLELKNLSVRQNRELFESMISSKFEIHDSTDKIVSRQDDTDALFRSHSPRNDIFLVCEFEVPPKVPPGTYTLWIEIKDTLSKPARTTRKAIELRIGD
jgi:hypothetical protein